jgi:hypothetical protein
MRYINTYEGHKEKLALAKENKYKLGKMLVNYMLKFFPSNIEYDNGTVYIEGEHIYVFKEKNILLTVWSDSLELQVRILLEWFRKEGFFGELIRYDQTNHESYRIYFNDDYLDKILESMKNFIDSGEIDFKINIRKYNL